MALKQAMHSAPQPWVLRLRWDPSKKSMTLWHFHHTASHGPRLWNIEVTSNPSWVHSELFDVSSFGLLWKASRFAGRRHFLQLCNSTLPFSEKTCQTKRVFPQQTLTTAHHNLLKPNTSLWTVARTQKLSSKFSESKQQKSAAVQVEPGSKVTANQW